MGIPKYNTFFSIIMKAIIIAILFAVTLNTVLSQALQHKLKSCSDVPGGRGLQAVVVRTEDCFRGNQDGLVKQPVGSDNWEDRPKCTRALRALQAMRPCWKACSSRRSLQAVQQPEPCYMDLQWHLVAEHD